jgi:hypothetical protein
VLPEPDTFHAMHVDTRNSDEIWSVAAPVVQYEWTAEPELYVAEGPTFDNAGNLYFAPVGAREDVSLVSLDRETGRRRWSIPGRGAGCGAPLVLNDPEDPPQQRIYHATYTTAMALRSDGSAIWSVPTGLAPPPREPGERDQTHVWGMSYHPPADALFGVTMDGFVFVLDRKTGAPLLRAPFRLPGAPAAASGEVPEWLAKRANRETDAAFGATPSSAAACGSRTSTRSTRRAGASSSRRLHPTSRTARPTACRATARSTRSSCAASERAVMHSRSCSASTSTAAPARRRRSAPPAMVSSCRTTTAS